MNYDIPYVINAQALRSAMALKGFSSVDELASALGLHRNTVGNYLQGITSLPSALNKILSALELPPEAAFKGGQPRLKVPGLKIAPLVDSLLTKIPDSGIVLYGSRARGKHKRYSDYDLGIFRANAITFSDFSPLLTLVDDYNQSSLDQVQLTNLSLADADFLTNIREDFLFLGGSLQAWIALLYRAGITLYE